MQTEQLNSTGLPAGGAIGRVRPTVTMPCTRAASTLPAVSGATAPWTTLTAALGVLVTSDDAPRDKRHRSRQHRKLNVSVDCRSSFAPLMRLTRRR